MVRAMTELQLLDGEEVLIGPDDMMLESAMREEYDLPESPGFSAHFDTGRDWTSEVLEDGGHTVRTKPDPTVNVYETEDGYVAALVVAAPDPIFFRMFSVPDGHLSGFIRRLIKSVEGSFDGIENVDVLRAKGQFTQLETQVTEQVADILSEA